MNVEVSKALPKEMNFSSKGKEFMVEFHYPWLPSRCQHCDKWGHAEKVCALKRKGKEKDISSASKSKEEDGSKEVVDVGDKGEEGKEIMMGTSSTHREDEVALNTRTDDVEKWLQVSPGKVGRSSPEIGDTEIQISASKFTVLSINDEEEGEIPVEAQDFEIDDLAVGEEKLEISEEEMLEDRLLEGSIGKDKSITQRGRKKGQKAKAWDENPMRSKRSSRRKN